MAPWRLIYGQSHTDGWQVDAIRPPTLSRIHGVQVARLESRLSQTGADGSVAGRNIAFDVRTRNAAYLVTFDTVDAHAQQLAALADGAIATLDALPVKAAGDASDALAWLARAVMAAVVLVALGYRGVAAKARGAASTPATSGLADAHRAGGTDGEPGTEKEPTEATTRRKAVA